MKSESQCINNMRIYGHQLKRTAIKMVLPNECHNIEKEIKVYLNAPPSLLL